LLVGLKCEIAKLGGFKGQNWEVYIGWNICSRNLIDGFWRSKGKKEIFIQELEDQVQVIKRCWKLNTWRNQAL